MRPCRYACSRSHRYPLALAPVTLALPLLLLPAVAFAGEPAGGVEDLLRPTDRWGREVVESDGQRLNHGPADAPDFEVADVDLFQGAAPRGPLPPRSVAGDLDVSLEWYRAIYGTGIGDRGLHIADLDGDGQTEIIAAASSHAFFKNSFWYVMRHDGVGYPQVWTSPPAESFLNALWLEDVNGDGDDEIVVQRGLGGLEVWDGMPPTRIQTFTNLPGGAGDSTHHIVDVDLDGELELVYSSGFTLYVVDYATGTEEWSAAVGGDDLAIGNVDGDPAPEIVIADNPGRVIDGVTTFTEWSNPTGFGRKVRLADIDGDGMDEIIAADGWYQIRVWDGDTQTLTYSISTARDIAALRMADADADGALELLYGDGQWGSLHIHNAADGTLEMSVPNPEHGVTDLAVGDADDDGDLDLLWGAGYSSSGADYLFAQDLTTNQLDWQSFDITGPFYALAHGDVDGDGAPELVSGCFESESGYGDGLWFVHDAVTKDLEFTSAEPTGSDFIGLHRVRLAQLDADPQLEVFVTTASGYTPKVIVYDGLTHAEELTITGENGLEFVGMEVVDVDLDGGMEVVITTGRAHTGPDDVVLEVYDAATGTLEWRSPLATNFTVFPYLRIAELDGDASPEIVVGRAGGNLWIFDGVTQSAQLTDAPADVSSLDTADRDGDGTDELLVATSSGQILEVDPATGNTISTLFSMPGHYIRGLRMADLDEDGTLDFVFVADHRLRVISGDDGSVLHVGQDELSFIAAQWDSLLVGDFDQDGAQEIWLNLDKIGTHLYQVGDAGPVEPPPPAVEDYLARWTFDGDFLDVSGNAHHGTGFGGVGFGAGVEGSALAADGQDDEVRVSAHPDLDNLFALTVSAWIRAPQEPRWRSIVDKRDAGADGFDLFLDSVGHAFLRVDNTTLTGLADLDDGEWHHVAGVWDGVELRLYVDGVLDRVGGGGSGVVDTTADLRIGGHFAGGPFGFAGGLDDVRLYDRALDASEIAIVRDEVPPVVSDLLPGEVLPSGTTQTVLSVRTDEPAECRASDLVSTSGTSPWHLLPIQLTSADDLLHEVTLSSLGAGSLDLEVVCRDLAGHRAAPVPATIVVAAASDVHLGLTGFWRFDEGVGTVTVDASTGGHDGTITGAAWAFGSVGHILEFTAPGDRVDIPSAAAFSRPGTLSLAAWVRVDGGSGYRSVIDVRDGNIDGYDLFIDPQGRAFMRVDNATVTGSTSVADGSWHHLVAVYDGADLVLYVDGAEDARVTVGALDVDVTAGPRIGAHFSGSGSFGFFGAIDEVRIYDRVLGVDEAAYLLAN
ncbi:MAG: LamG-like jellyroll fold domain-containing protein [Acidobacteriota bacterium]